MTTVFLSCLSSPPSPEVSEVLAQLVTPEVLDRRTDLDPQWRMFAISRHPVEPGHMPWPDD